METRGSAEQAVAVAVVSAAISAVTWAWCARVFQAKSAEVKEDAWEHVKDEYPLPAETSLLPVFSSEMATAVVEAHPFSPQRRAMPSPTEGQGPLEAAVAAEPKFVYKGQINMGQRPRAIVEETGSRKTYFLEVGQEVAGFKVLDIAENRVVLSHLQTQEEMVVSLKPSSAQEPKKSQEPPRPAPSGATH